jgi:RNA polymerase sigma-70 factor (ECF subfamily)
MTAAEAALVDRAQRGDRAAFEELVRRVSGLLYARLYLETGDPHRAEDLVQETLLVAFRSLAKLDNPRRFRSWLLTIAQNVAIDAARRDLRKKRAGRRADGTELDGLSGPTAPPDEQVAQKEQRDQVLAVLRSLPEDYRLPLTLRYISGADYETIQTQLGLSNGSLRGLLHRGLQLLRTKLQAAAERGAVAI